MLLICIQDVPGSNISLDTDYSDQQRFFSGFSRSIQANSVTIPSNMLQLLPSISANKCSLVRNSMENSLSEKLIVFHLVK
jgi:hypothetical protein